MKIVLKENTQKEIERLNLLYGEENSPEYDYWEKMSALEVLIADAGLYADGAYERYRVRYAQQQKSHDDKLMFRH